MKKLNVFKELRRNCWVFGTVVTLFGCATSSYHDSDFYLATPRIDFDTLNSEKYTHLEENNFKTAINSPISTFSIDVDTASYSNVRRFIIGGNLPPPDAVRIEELINYFTYSYPEPESDQPFTVSTEVASAPWNNEHKLIQIGLKGRDVELGDIPKSNLVFLIDVSGSMHSRLPLVKSALKLLVKQLRKQDRIAIVVYAGAAGIVLPLTFAVHSEMIVAAIDQLQTGGSTAGGAGINLAYKIAQENYDDAANNRVILITDGDFNVGPSSASDLLKLIEEKRIQNVYLTVLGFGSGNINDTTMELLANKGNGNYAYIDSMMEAKKVLVNELSGTLFTIAKDVKIQVEFNPARVQSYRLIGYENRLLNKEDFTDDSKDAGEIGAGHTVTALYEIVVTDSPSEIKDSGLYVQTVISNAAIQSNELATVGLRYKNPNESDSVYLAQPIINANRSIESASENLRFASAVAEFGLLLKNSNHQGNSDYEKLIARAKGATGEDKDGIRNEFIQLAETAKVMAK